MTERVSLEDIGDAYLVLLRLPPAERMKVQKPLSVLRDLIAERAGRESCSVQDSFEAVSLIPPGPSSYTVTSQVSCETK